MQFFYAWLTGNGDLHVKNVAVVESASNHWEVAPMYDALCTALYGDFTMALPVAGRTKKLQIRHWREFADSVGLPQAAATLAMKRVGQVAEGISLKDLPFSGSSLYGAERELGLRRWELERL